MKKLVSTAVIVLAFLGGLASSAAAQSRIGFRLGGGLGYVGGGEVNKGLQGYSDYYFDAGTLMGYSVQNGYKPFHLGMDLNGEILFQVTPEIAIGLGAGYLQASRSSEINISTGSASATISWKPNASAIPLTLNFHYSMPAGARLRFVIHAGVGYYLAKLDLEEMEGPFSLKHDLSGSGFGAHGGIGLEIGISPNVALVFDVLGRYASISELKGDQTNPGGTDTGGKLYYAELDAGFGQYSLVEYSVETPTGGMGVSNIHAAKLDFSGFSAVIGFLFRF